MWFSFKYLPLKPGSRRLTRQRILAAGLAVSLTGLGPGSRPLLADPAGPPAREVAAVKAQLAHLQRRSFETGYEYCGYLGRTPDGRLRFTKIRRGDFTGCTPRWPPGDEMEPVASIHTHGAYDHEVPAEFPTVIDMDSDRREGVDGYIATPGGRLWFIDGQARTARQLCGLGCLPQDPDFSPGDDGVIARNYTRAELSALESAQ